MSENFTFRTNNKHRKRLLEDVKEEFRDMHNKDSLSADVELALEKALDWVKRRNEIKQELEKQQKELENQKEKWDLD